MANFTSSDYPSELQIIVECLSHSVLNRAFTISENVPQSLVNLAFSSAVYQRESDRIQFEVQGGSKKSINKKNFTRLLGLPTEGTFITPTVEELLYMFNQMGYTPYITKISQFKKNKLPMVWNFFFTLFKRCLCGRKGGQDSASQLFLTALYGVYYNLKVDFGAVLWYEFVESLRISTRDSELSSHRFWSVIVHSAYIQGKLPIDSTVSPVLQIQTLQVPAKFADQSEFSFVGQVPQSMLVRIPLDNSVVVAYMSTMITPPPVRQIPDEVQKEITSHASKHFSKKKEGSCSSCC